MAQTARHPGSGVTLSVVSHALVLGLLLFATRHRHEFLRSLHLPGTPQGQHVMLSYSLGGPQAVAQSSPLHATAPRVPKPRVPTPSPAPAPATPSPALSQAGTGSSGDSALGDENVRIALPQVHPRPQPDLSVLAHGTAGDVVVDVVINDTGKVTSTTLVKGLAPPIDNFVMQALRDWTFSPATRNGQNIASEQEVLIHYERG